MDKISHLASKVGGHGGHSSGSGSGAGARGQEDYVDKGELIASKDCAVNS